MAGNVEYYPYYDMQYETINIAERCIKKYWDKIVCMELERLSEKEMSEMEDQIQVNCLKKGNFERCRGKKYFLAVDGTDASNRAFDIAIKILEPKKDHLFICTVYDGNLAPTSLLKRANVLITYKAWTAACNIVKKYEELMLRSGLTDLDYTVLVPASVRHDAREMVVTLSNNCKVDTIIMGKHGKKDKKTIKKRHWKSFHSYVKKHSSAQIICVS